MGKLAALLATGCGASAASVGGVLLFRGEAGTAQSTQRNEENLSSTGAAATVLDDLSFRTLQEFKKEKGGSCPTNYFLNLSYENLTGVISGSAPVNESDLQSSSTEEGHPKSCLIINWEKITSTNKSDSTKDKWTGNFRFLWSFVNGNRGFVMFYTTKPSEKDKQFDLEGGIYFVVNEDENWKIKKHKEISDTSKHLDQSSFGKSFPETAGGFDGLDEEHKTNWGFVKANTELEGVCKEGNSDCPSAEANKTDFKGVWNWQVDVTNGISNPDKWNKKFKENLNYLFGNDGFNISNAFETFKGSWKKQVSN